MPPPAIVAPRPVPQQPMVGLSTTRTQRTPGKTKKKDPSPSKVKGQVEPDEGTTQKVEWHACPECPRVGPFAVLNEFAVHMYNVHRYSWVCPVCGRK